MKLHLSEDEVNDIVDSDPKAESAMRHLLDQFRSGAISQERFARQRHNIRGNALARHMRETSYAHSR